MPVDSSNFTFRKFVRFVHGTSMWLTGWLTDALLAASAQAGRRDIAARRRYLLGFQLAQAVVVAAAFLLVADRYRLFCNILYSTPAGFVVGAMDTATQISSREGDALRDAQMLLLGSDLAWLTVGLENVLLNWYYQVLETYEKSRPVKALSMLLFTYASGAVLTAVMGFLYGKRTLLGRLSAVPVLYYPVLTVLGVVLLALIICALDAAMQNYVLVLGAAICALPAAWAFEKLLDALVAGTYITVTASMYRKIIHLFLLAAILIGYYIWTKLVQLFMSWKNSR